MTSPQQEVLANYKDEIVKHYFEKVRDAESCRHKEISSVIGIQSLWRGYVARKHLDHLACCATAIQRVFRGYRARKRARLLATERQRAHRRALFDAVAVLIQKMYRGYRSRKFVQDFYARKRYLESVTAKSQNVRQRMQKAFEEETRHIAESAEQAKEEEFNTFLEKSHYMLSTEAREGVFASPFGEEHAPKAFGVPIETHIREAYENRRRNRREPSVSKKG